MKNYTSNNGTKLNSTFMLQKEYGMAMIPVNSDELFESVTPEMARTVKCLIKDKVFAVQQIASPKGSFMLDDSLVIVSQYFRDTIIKKGFGGVRWKVIFSHDEEELFSITNADTIRII